MHVYDLTQEHINIITLCTLACVHAQGGKVIGHVIVVVVSTKIALSRDLGT